MAFRNITRSLVRILVFITLGAVAIVFTDLVVFKKQHEPDPYWWKHNVFTKLAYWSPDPNRIDIATLKSRHASYLEEGIDIPQGIVIEPAFPSQTPEKTAVNNLEVTEGGLSEIEPAAGKQGNKTQVSDLFILGPSEDNYTAGLNVLGLEEEDISDIFSRRNVEDYILSYGEVPEYELIEPAAGESDVEANPELKLESEPKINQNPETYTQKHAPEAEEIKLANVGKKAFEVYTHAPVEVEEDKYPDDTDKGNYIKPEGTGKIAIIIDDMGVSLRSKLVEVLPGPLTLSYLPYAEDLKERVQRAHANGHELMVHMPMEPLNGNLDAGPHVLMTSQSEEDMLDTLDWGLTQFEGYDGINNHMGSRITADKEAMDKVMAVLKEKGLFFVDSRTINSSVAAQSARDAGIPYAVRDIFLDHEVTPEFIQNALKKLEDKASARGYAIAIAHPHKETIDALKDWIPSLEEKGLTLVPVNELLYRPVAEDAQVKLN